MCIRQVDSDRKATDIDADVDVDLAVDINIAVHTALRVKAITCLLHFRGA